MSDLADGHSLIIRDTVTGAELELKDAALPFRGVEAGSKLRHKTTWYPGASSASQQVLGTEEEPIRFQGEWRDTLIGAEDGAFAHLESLRGLWIAQHVVELTWGTVLVRRGLISRIAPTFKGQAVIGWALEFTPNETNDPQAVAPVQFPPEPEMAISLWRIVDEVCDALTTAAAVGASINAMV